MKRSKTVISERYSVISSIVLEPTHSTSKARLAGSKSVNQEPLMLSAAAISN
jgi:hypothetical protein